HTAEHLGRNQLDQFGDFAWNLGIEEGFRHYAERELHHLLKHVQRQPVLPAFAGSSPVIHHHTSVLADSLAMKGALHQSSLDTMQLAFAGNQSFAENPLSHRGPALLDELAVICDEYVMDIVGMIDEVNRLRPF